MTFAPGRSAIHILGFAQGVSSARYLSKRELEDVNETVKKVIGEKQMPTILEQFVAEGEARGKAEGKAESVIRTLARRHGTVPVGLADRVRAITDIEKLDQLFDLAFDCGTLNEFERSLEL